MIAGAAKRHRFKIHFIKDYLEVKSYLQKNACQASVSRDRDLVLIGLENLPALIQ